MEVLNERETLASICTTLPSLMGFSKEILSTEAVTTGAPQCFIAASAEAISIQYINLPPIRFPNVFVSFGNTNSVIITNDSLAFLSMQKCLNKDKGNWKLQTLHLYHGIPGPATILFPLIVLFGESFSLF